MTVKIAPALAGFSGEWSLSRRIIDHRAGSTGQFDGTAVFTLADYGLSYFETGKLTLPGHAPFTAERRYRWCEVDGLVSVEFEDGRFFHSFDATTPEAQHWCDPDTYQVRYMFDEWPVWTSTWRVSGPRKDYEMVSSYQRPTG